MTGHDQPIALYSPSVPRGSPRGGYKIQVSGSFVAAYPPRGLAAQGGAWYLIISWFLNRMEKGPMVSYGVPGHDS